MDSEILTGHKFSLSVDQKLWGFFTRCTGLACVIALDELDVGGMNESLSHLPRHLTYPPLTLTRPLTAEAMKTCKWVQQTARHPRRITLGIACLDAKNNPVAQWDVLNAMPVAWRGPVLDAGGDGEAVEELKIVHEGFMSS